MKCKTIHKNLIFYLEGELPENKMEQIRAHLSECEECAAFAEDMKKTLGILEEEKSSEINPFFYTRLKAKIETVKEPVKIPFWRPVMVKVVQPVFFSVLLIAGIYAGIKIGTPVKVKMANSSITAAEIFPYMNEMQSEPIEDFLMEMK